MSNEVEVFNPLSVPASIALKPETIVMRDDALAAASLVVKVDSEMTQGVAVDAQKDLTRVVKMIEDARVAVKAPVLDLGRAIDRVAKEATDKVKAELGRLTRLLGDYQQLEIAKAKSAEAARNAELTALERSREERLATCETLEDRERVHEEFSQLTQVLQPPATPPKESGQVVTQDVEFEVIDIHDLYRWHPMLVTLEPKRREIKEMLKNGIAVRGVKYWAVVKSTVRLEKSKDITS